MLSQLSELSDRSRPVVAATLSLVSDNLLDRGVPASDIGHASFSPDVWGAELAGETAPGSDAAAAANAA